MKSKPIASIVAIFLAATSVTACSDKGSKSARPETEAQIYANAKKSLPHADIKVPDSSYQVASNSNADLYFARLAFENPPLNYDAIAKSLDYKYANTNDAFMKQEILATLKPRIDQRIENAKANFEQSEGFKEIAEKISVKSSDCVIIDAEGSYVIPGAIDDQVHFREPGLTHKGNIETESKAAIAGGITSFIEQPNTVPNAVTQELLEQKYQIAAESSHANYSFMICGTNDYLEEVL